MCWGVGKLAIICYNKLLIRFFFLGGGGVEEGRESLVWLVGFVLRYNIT